MTTDWVTTSGTQEAASHPKTAASRRSAPCPILTPDRSGRKLFRRWPWNSKIRPATKRGIVVTSRGAGRSRRPSAIPRAPNDARSVAASGRPDLRRAPGRLRGGHALSVDFAPAAEASGEGLAMLSSEQLVLGATTIASTAFSVGYVIWLVRCGSLVASMLASLPAWSSFDPLPILTSRAREEDDEDDERLVDIIG